jgi:hypothetical protein
VVAATGTATQACDWHAMRMQPFVPANLAVQFASAVHSAQLGQAGGTHVPTESHVPEWTPT